MNSLYNETNKRETINSRLKIKSMKEISRRLKHQSQFSIKDKKCLNCCETLIFTGVDSKSHGWIEHFKCTKCYTLHEFSSNDMGQGSDDLWSVSSWENHKQLTAER